MPWVEDEEPAAKTLINCLNKYAEQNGKNFSVTRFDDAVIFLEEYKANYDIVFMDVLLPKMNGMDAAKRLREIDKNTILIFVTNMAKFAVKGYEVAALDFIVKPVVYSSFVMKMDKAVKAAICRRLRTQTERRTSLRFLPLKNRRSNTQNRTVKT